MTEGEGKEVAVRSSSSRTSLHGHRPSSVVVVARSTAPTSPDRSALGLPGGQLRELEDVQSVVTAIDLWRGRLAKERLARGDRILALHQHDLTDGPAVGWVHLSYTSHADDFSGLDISVSAKQAYMYDLEVREDGPPSAGAILIRTAVALARSDGAQTVFGWVEVTNRPALLGLCAVGGFQQVGEVRTSAAEQVTIGLALEAFQHNHLTLERG